jgi:hypothetical protein
MGVNAYTTNLGVRERQSTYVPLPFEQMYAVLQDKQKRYDLADAYEREEKRKISKLSSPIKEFNNYYTDLKKKYLEDVTALHSTFGGDKASSQYQRKLQDIVDGYATDPNHNLIQESNENYLKWIETTTKQKAENKYSPVANKFYENFKATNDDGSFNKFLFAGVREKINTQEALAKANLMTPVEENVTSFPKGNTVVTLTGKGKKADKMYNNMLSFLGNDGLEDYAADNGISVDVARKQLQTVAASSSDYNVSTKIDPNYEGFNASLNAAQFGLTQQKFAQDISNEMFNRKLSLAQLELAKSKNKADDEENKLKIAKLKAEIAAMGGTTNPDGTIRVPLPNVNNNLYDPNISGMIGTDGKVIGNIYNDAPWYQKALTETFPDLASTGDENPQDPLVIKAQNILEEQERNARVVNSYLPKGKKLDVNEVRKKYKNSAKTTTFVNTFKNPEDADKALDLIMSQYATYNFHLVSGESSKILEPTQVTNLVEAIIAKQKKEKSASGFVQGPLAAFNTFGPQAISMQILGDIGDDAIGENPHIIVSRIPETKYVSDALALQEYQLAQGYAQKIPVKLSSYIDPETREILFDTPVEIFWGNFNDIYSSRIPKPLK